MEGGGLGEGVDFFLVLICLIILVEFWTKIYKTCLFKFRKYKLFRYY